MSDHIENPSVDIANRNMRETAAAASLTELEGVILGIVWSRQPCSAYVVVKRFQRSTTWGWSSSTGAIYPAIRRLITRGLLDGEPEARTGRKAIELSLTAEGLHSLRDWIDGLADEMASAGIDPIRSRANYLAALEPDAREAFICRAERITRARLRVVEQNPPDLNARDNWTLEAANVGVALALKARLQWLKELRRLMRQAGRSGVKQDPR
ncbi:PadR family transcriptional regulator [Sphingomonas sinipercae]|uniref:PadR family transcriptional regulator n=1 Tax=Sphingomonas sinipercae TaxID=2714944 RepID=A0A6G7ZQ30_9SPHN|nr:PadR family transcriptional regulator [Sphingomonas sinipercae]QIL03038.1 PadR family transcriptional regulator [Sphingomonas sinipercae]